MFTITVSIKKFLTAIKCSETEVEPMASRYWLFVEEHPNDGAFRFEQFTQVKKKRDMEMKSEDDGDFVSIFPFFNDPAMPEWRAVTPKSIVTLEGRVDFIMTDIGVEPLLVTDVINVLEIGENWKDLDKDLILDM
ncbi:hypothetical protein K435DRAFT_802185 [Dendrothele bispora CBS 962.96]|uniref:Uncharacterized protein n=1 Tax=Dendrothele bispora (strain CBS 962.96) TaxID=1314807 RepID=A0A4S8LLQ3_DENBC|nr:hypothetical protein K435DRAFT_802185 [Dendrothele bispora CBS 962.96]